MNTPNEENKPSDSGIPESDSSSIPEESDEDQEEFDENQEEFDENQEPQADLEEIADTAENPNINVDDLKSIKVDPSTLLEENTRTRLAYSLVGLLAATLVLLGIYIFSTKDSKESESTKSSKELLTLVWTSEVTLVSGALGYYFASNKGR
ncbi:MAG: hypothetical protein DCF20_15480 [Pseudanabaena sp.]|nr:MAG: hypothetical protein DCF20_15480 [Pseudanabaena sp.]